MDNKYKNFVTPKTYLVGCTSVDISALTSYLEDTNQTAFLEEIQQAKQEGLSDGEILCSFYAKLCYASLAVGKNKNISKVRAIKDNIIGTINSGHGCYDGETEVMTKEGWKNWAEVKETDIFATLNPEGKCEWSPAIRLFKYDYEGEMISFQSNRADLLVTPNHNMLVVGTTTREGRQKHFKNHVLTRADSLLTKSHSHLKCLPFEIEKQKDLDPFYQLLGFAIGDGSISWNKLRFHIRRDRKIKYLYSIAEKMGVEITTNTETDNYSLALSDLPIEGLIRGIYSEDKQKLIPWTFFENPTDNQILSLFDGLMNSDGSSSGNGDVYDTTSEVLAGQVQFLANLMGRGATISQAECYKQIARGNYRKSLKRVHIHRMSICVEFNKSSDDIYAKVGKVNDWKGTVYCAEVKNNTLFVRRNGKSLWCGNSVLEHCMLNFVVTDASRIFTHEQVRHRAGTAYSQSSGRYIRTDILNVIIDPILEPAYDLVEEARAYLEDWYKRLETRLDIQNEKSFPRKKKLTSAMRRMLPNGQSNELGFSLNLRTLRQVIEARTSEHAEWEIRLIYNQVYDLVKEKYPAIFADAKLEMIEGLYEITFKNKKI